MTTKRMPDPDFDRLLTAWFESDAQVREPEAILEDALARSRTSRQRPAWLLPEWWIPMRLTMPLRAAPRLVPLLLLIALLVVAIVAIVAVGSRPRVPAPFGPARNGLVAYASGGDIYSVDPVSGASNAIVKGPEIDLDPRWSQDGMRLVFERKATDDSGPGNLFVAGRDGSDLIRVTPEPLTFIESYSFSPDGKEILIATGPAEAPRVLIAAADGRRIRELDLGTPARAAWRPPDGSEVLVMDLDGSVVAVAADTGNVRMIKERLPGRSRTDPKWSPDGSLISYVEWFEWDGMSAQTHIMAADGTGDRILPIPLHAVWQAGWHWSNDGTRLLAIRGFAMGMEGSRAAVIPVDGSGSGIEIEYPGAIQAGCCSSWEWAPDDSSILGTPTSESGAFVDQVLLDPVAGTFRTVPWSTVSHPSWQRLAP